MALKFMLWLDLLRDLINYLADALQLFLLYSQHRPKYAIWDTVRSSKSSLSDLEAVLFFFYKHNGG